MKLQKTRTLFVIFFVVILTSCKTYYITTASLQDQFKNIDSSDYKLVKVSGVPVISFTYLANPIDTIRCIDKNKNPAVLINSPAIEMRVTQQNGRKTVFYFDRIYLSDSLLYGTKSRFIPSIDKTIPLKNIVKIEVQEGGKNLRYQ